MSYRGVIFDLDGTLIDSLMDIGESMNRALIELGYAPHPLDAYRYFVGDGVRLLVQRALPETTQKPELAEKVLHRYRTIYRDHWRQHTHPYPGIETLLRRLHEINIPMAVLSNKPDGVTLECVAHFFPSIPFRRVSGQREAVPRKPDPTAALEIAALMKLHPAEIVFVGDTATDMMTATAAGMFPAGVAWGFRGEDELIAHGAQLVAQKSEALLGLFMDDPP